MDEMKKYIIEFSEDPHTIRLMKLKNGDECPTTEFKAVSPYTEPDLEQIRKEAYEDGYKTAKVQCNIQVEKDMREVGERHYQKGLSDAWDAARKIAHCFLWGSYQRETGRSSACAQDVLDHYSASEAIEKIRQYEQEKEKSEEQKKQESITAEEVMRQYLDNFCRGRKCTGCPLHTPDFTCGRGKYFLYDSMSDEEVRRAYAAVLAKMKES